MARFMRRPLPLMALAILTLAYLIAVPVPALAAPTWAAVPRQPMALGVIAKSLPPAGLSVQAASRIAPVTYPVPAGKTAEGYAAELRATGRFAYVEPNYIRTVTAYTTTPNDPDFQDAGQWYWGSLLIDHAKSWYLRGSGSANFDKVWQGLAVDGLAYHARVAAAAVPVAVIDTGFYMDHPDRGNIVARKDCLSYYSTATGRHTDLDVTPVPASAPLNSEANTGHGTLTASLIGEDSNNGAGTAGAGYDAEVYIYKAQGTWLEGNAAAGYPVGAVIMTDDAVIDGIRTAADDGCKVISMSLGGPSPSSAMQDAIDYAWSHGVVVVASAGNTGGPALLYPGAANHVLGVGSVFLDSSAHPVRSTFSSYGTGLDIMAPGEGIWGPIRPGYTADSVSVPGYTWWSGTSMAAPLVSAAAATVLRLEPTLTPDEVAGILTSSATDMGTPGYDTTTGWGELNARAAVAKVAATYPVLMPPRLSGITASANYSSNPTPTLSWAPVAGYGPITYTVRGDWASTPLYTGTGTTLSITGIPDGTRQVSVTPASPRNWSDATSVATVKFAVNVPADTTPPTTTSSFNPAAGSVYAANQPVTLTASDTGGPGVKTTYYKIDAGSFIAGTSFTVTGDGLHTFSYYSVDNANNTETTHVSAQFRIDTTAPSTTCNAVAAHTYTGSQTFTLTPTDTNGSGVAGTWWQLDSTSGSWTSGTTVAVAAPASGTVSHTLYFYSRDAAGNEETPHKQVQFSVSAAPTAPMPVWRFYNMRTGTHFYTADPAEKANVQNTMGATYHLDGVGYTVNTANPANSTTLWRFYNMKTGTHFYTADPAEKARVQSTMASTYHLDGAAYNVSATNVAGSTTVWRFYNMRTGTHFYTADAAEKANVIANLGAIYHLDGPAFYLAP